MADVAMESEGKAAGGRVTCSCGGGYDWVGCDFFCVPLFYVTRLLTATMRSHAIACDRMRSHAIASDRMRYLEKKPFFQDCPSS